MGTSAEISYGLFDVTAKSDSAPATADKQPFVDLAQLKEMDLQVEKFATGERNQFILDGSFKLFPDDPTSHDYGLWSLSMSDSTGAFLIPPVLTITFSENHSSLGLTLRFHESTGDYCDRLNVKYYNSAGNLLLDQNYNPTNVLYFADGQAEDYRKIVITFLGTNKPYRYAKLTEIKYGILKIFGPESLLSANILEEIDPLSAELSINTLDFKIHTNDFAILDMKGVYALLQRKQSVDVVGIIDSVRKPMGTFYLNEPKSDSNRTTTMSCIDLIGVIDQTDFKGGLYTGVLASIIIDAIMASAGGIEYELGSSFAAVTLSGWIPICTHREALQQVAFAIGAIVDCTRGDKIKLYPPPTVPMGSISYSMKLDGHKLKLRPLVTGVEVIAHNYKAITASQEILNEVKAPGTYEITFIEPIHSLAVTGGTIISSNANYVRISVTNSGTVLLTGHPYVDSTQIFGTYMPELPANEKTNVLKIEDATLVSNNNAQGVANRIYAYYQNRYQAEGPIKLTDEEPGQIWIMDSMNDRQLEGIVESMDINLTGGFLANARITGKAVT